MSILGLINISKLEKEEQAKATYLELMSRSVHKLDHFIGDIINLSRNARLEVQSMEIDFEQLIDQVLEGLQYMPGSEAIEKRISLQLQAPFYSDEKRLQVIFTNILSNAIRYMNERQDKPWVAINIEVSKELAIIEVADNGIGIAAEHLQKVFHIFYRASEQKAGSGLGLYIVKETVDKLQGKVAISSQVNMGTQLTIQLPNMGKK
jgi:signal transduction histidine kinase